MPTDLLRTARKQHRCCECAELIHAGEQYHYHKSLFDGAWQEYKMCLRCWKLFGIIDKLSHPDCVCFTGLREAYLEMWTLDDFDGLVPAAWVQRAQENLAYREKYYGLKRTG